MTTKWMQRIIDRREGIEVRKIGASRAKYESPDISKIEMRIALPDDLGEITLIMTGAQTHELIMNLTTSYNAAYPPIKGQGSIGLFG